MFAVLEAPMCLTAPAQAQRSAPSPNPEPDHSPAREPGDPRLIFTLPEDCPARLGPEDLADPDRYHRRLKEWLLRQK